MAYQDWPEEFQQLWDDYNENTGGALEGLDGPQQEYVEFMFEEGFMHYAGEVPPDDTSFARDEFFDMIGLEYEDYFDWAAWREALYGES